MKPALLLLFTIPFAGFGQANPEGYPRDTSYTVWSAFQKVRVDYPNATAVKEFNVSTISSRRDVVYYTLSKRNLHADLFFPGFTGQKNVPAVILIHGGGWASGNKSHLVPLAQKLAENGFFAASFEYRLSPESLYPSAIIDLKTAIKWLKSNADEFYIDTNRVAVLGASAGATLATFIGLTSQNSMFDTHLINTKATDKVQAIVNIDGILDFTDPAESGKDQDPAKPSAAARWFGCTYNENPAVWKQASPISYADKNAPPTLFINSSFPRYHAGRDEYLKILQRNSIYYEVFTIPETPHTFWLFNPWFDETYPIIIRFLHHVFPYQE